MRWATFFDRDGVLTGDGEGGHLSPMHASELLIAPGAREAVQAVREVGGLVCVVTNQPEVARGNLELHELELMQAHMADVFDLDPEQLAACPHDDGCPCRKPLPGMFLALAEELDIDLRHSVTVGDRWVDIAAGAAAGTTTILIDRSYSWQRSSGGLPPEDLRPDHRVADVVEAGVLAARLGSPIR